jgi:hypothetical protein
VLDLAAGRLDGLGHFPYLVEQDLLLGDVEQHRRQPAQVGEAG